MKNLTVIIFAGGLLLTAFSSGPSKGEIEAGEKLYIKYACMSCHGKDGVMLGDLRQAYKKYTDEQMKAYIKNPRQFNNVQMPVFESVIAEADYKLLITYVKWLGQKADAAKK